MKGFLLLFLFLSANLCLASAEINVSGADANYNTSLKQCNITTLHQQVLSIFIFNDNGNSNGSLEAVQIPTMPTVLSQIFTWNDVSSNTWPLEKGSIPTIMKHLRQIFVVHEFARYQKDLAYPMAFLNDTNLPVISDVIVVGIKSSEARINWTTDEFATSLVKYGTTLGGHGISRHDDLYSMNHSILLDGLSSGTKYYFVANSTDRTGNSAESQASFFETSA
jgi:hypothetical protein